ncbi:S-adenosyl-L-methionine-dependent methyltransferase [Aspergillus campestris IBT 28561]|uniref:S-adenosyl-L-methionine-dependent methyltransferase n=1 Tax=Aspergillus campestris (strain IBT 28561) TaxID=1392248 RepID=A0A2I1CXS0_ASPC2|nr:S-adenosyl-L-methionine-dependent methyltransferase [Aspergillus campestris IBT 28561]PKY02411.1 S-adenosyl-L-methionine-dependent methyltransferase [Aspergillus campestris IBT 28561]
MSSSDIPTPDQASQHPDEVEEKNVHEVYQQIAGHFSSTRHKPWPMVERFLSGLTPGSVGLDVGCGNGKYLPVNRDVFIIASDRSDKLAQIAVQHQPHSTIVADILNLPHPESYFDFAISIAVVHHLSTPDRRVLAIREILRTLKPVDENGSGGRALVYVWALEQSTSRRGWDKGDAQDIMVPWVMKGKLAPGGAPTVEPKVFHRYYHLYSEKELEQDIHAAGGRVVESGYERDNWWAVATRND